MNVDGQRPRPVALTIAGSDSSGGAGIQADLKTFAAHGVYGASVITAVTAQNTKGVRGVYEIPGAFVVQQLEAVVSDLNVGAAKTGMLANGQVIKALLASDALENVGQLVVDPVMVATSGDPLLEPEAVEALRSGLLSRAMLVTPNLAEAAILADRAEATSEEEMEAQAGVILASGCGAVLMKGGHWHGEAAVDLLVTRAGVQKFASPRVETRHTHGSGCTLSAAICANLASGCPLGDAVGKAKTFVYEAILSASCSPVGTGNAPLDHLVRWQSGSAEKSSNA